MEALLNYGFTQQDINILTQSYNYFGKVTGNTLTQLGCSYEQARKIMYANSIYTGKVKLDSVQAIKKHYMIVYGCSPEEANKLAYSYSLNSGNVKSKEDLVNHLKKINKNEMKLTINDLMPSKVVDVPRVAVVNGIKQEPFTIWNSGQYKGMEALYKVINVSGQNITIETSRKPLIARGASMKIDGVLSILGVKQDGKAVVTFNKDYCRLCNRFVILASLRNPEFHLGKYEIIAKDGTKVYVFASNMGIKESVNYRAGNQRVYTYGIMPSDIKTKLDKMAGAINSYVGGMSHSYSQPNSEYRVVPKVHIETQPEDDGLL